ncbi:MAG: efflux transporter outer membrane subunit [Proteobacteria bacterium]|nr:efflux transporter outer membrane subunit [Pseudomonadota bacterium]
MAALLAACASGPDYRKPALDMPAAWKVEAPWRAGTPNDGAPKGPWWKGFNDPELDRLQEQALAGSPTLAIAGARLAQSRAALASVSAALYPQVGLAARDVRTRITENRPLTGYATRNFSVTQTDLAGTLTVGYEADLSGRVRRSIEGARATAQQSAADFENIRLLLTADLATAYFNLRALDIELDVLARSLELQRRALGLAATRHDLGATSGLDVAQQQALLDSTLTQVDVLKKQRGQFEHAIATLTGTAAPLFSIAPQVKLLTPPPVPVGVPSDVLERRPDVAAAERAMAAANAQVGVASSAFYPSIQLGGFAGREGRTLPLVFDAPSLIWSLGAAVAMPLFDGGRIQANVDNASAGYEATVANYRRVVLSAMQEVEDGITGLAALERAHEQALAATASAAKVLDLATSRYEGGISTYLDVITAQQGLLNSERLAAQLSGQRLLTAVFLVKALGGDWAGAQALATK